MLHSDDRGIQDVAKQYLKYKLEWNSKCSLMLVPWLPSERHDKIGKLAIYKWDNLGLDKKEKEKLNKKIDKSGWIPDDRSILSLMKNIEGKIPNQGIDNSVTGGIVYAIDDKVVPMGISIGQMAFKKEVYGNPEYSDNRSKLTKSTKSWKHNLLKIDDDLKKKNGKTIWWR